MCDEDGHLVASASACGLEWDGDPTHLPAGGWADVVTARPAKADYACALGVSVVPSVAGAGIGARMLEALCVAAGELGLLGLVAPVRPIDRGRCPDLPIREYARLRLPDGEHFDRWIRTHERLGGAIVGACASSQTFAGTHGEWEAWTGLRLPETGRVLVDDAAGYLELDHGAGVLTEPAVWIEHDAAAYS